MMKYRINFFIKDQYRNDGYSWGLEYPFISAALSDTVWIIWHRHTGRVVRFVYGRNSIFSKMNAEKLCREFNGLTDKTDPAVIAAMDAVS